MTGTPHPDPLLVSYMTVRRSIGILGITLPAVLLLGNILLSDCNMLEASISDYYYTIMGNVFVGFLTAVAVSLILYKGYDNDHLFTNLAGVFALGVAFFPTGASANDPCSIFIYNKFEAPSTVHYISAALFFITLAYISFFRFTKSKGHKTNMKKTRNSVYRVCGIVIMLGIVLIFLCHKWEAFANLFYGYQPVFWFEWMALIAFGTSWLVKGEIILGDKKSN